MKNKLILSLALASFAVFAGASADTASTTATTTTATTTVSSKIACVGASVATREAALGVAMNAHGQAVNTAYSNRATALAQAYSLSDSASVRKAVRTAWSTFNSSIKDAQSNWRIARIAAWKQFYSSSRICRAPYSVNDSAHSYLEVKGQ